MQETNLYFEKLKLLEWLVKLQDTTILKKFIDLKERNNLSNSDKEFPPLTKRDLIARAKEANKDIETGNVHSIESIEKEIW
ncbi:MAG: hypothetical protein AB8G86_28865 [Saprospiraceae bacterium]